MWRRCQDTVKLVRPRRNFEKQISWSKFYDEVKHIYPGTIVQKFECIGHYQKRVGNRLRKLRIRTKGLGGKNKKVQTKDKGKGKVTKAKSRLTDSVIDKLQNYFGIALRSNVGDLQKMQDAILASLFHVASSYLKV